jgi:hypothetical protein
MSHTGTQLAQIFRKAAIPPPTLPNSADLALNTTPLLLRQFSSKSGCLLQRIGMVRVFLCFKVKMYVLKAS